MERNIDAERVLSCPDKHNHNSIHGSRRDRVEAVKAANKLITGQRTTMDKPHTAAVPRWPDTPTMAAGWTPIDFLRIRWFTPHTFGAQVHGQVDQSEGRRRDGTRPPVPAALRHGGHDQAGG
jgi:hypothetical protein